MVRIASLFFLLGVSACLADVEEGEEGGFQLRVVREVILEEPDSAPLTSLTQVEPHGSGTLLAVDRPVGAIRRYSADSGELLQSFGGVGEGPGEFMNPYTLAVTTSGAVLVGDQQPRLTRLTADLELDTVMPLESIVGVRQIEELPSGGAVVYGYRGRAFRRDAENQRDFLRIDEEGRVLGELIPSSPLESVPYWGSYWQTHVVPMPSGNFVVVRSMAYPIEVYGREGELLDTLGSPPPSYRIPSKPERGQFLPPNQREQANEWRETFTVIDGAWLFGPEGFKALAIQHSELRQVGTDGDRFHEYRLDVYRDGEKVIEDHPLPGPVVGAGEHLLLRVSEPPEGWGIGFMRLVENPPSSP